MTATLTRTLGKIVWRELFTADVPAAKRFYGSLFGWTHEDRPMGPDMAYTIWKMGDKEIGGMMDLANMPEGSGEIPPHWSVYVSVADVDKTAELAVAEGGTILGECHDIPGVGRFAMLRDPQGAHINLFCRTAGDGEDTNPEPGDFCWENLSTTDTAAATAFYQKVIGWGTTLMGDGPTTIFTRLRDGAPIGLASMGPAPEATPPAWTPFVGVESVTATTAKCRDLGGQVFVERTEIPDVGAFGVIQDPTGAVIFLFEQAGEMKA